MMSRASGKVKDLLKPLFAILEPPIDSNEKKYKIDSRKCSVLTSPDLEHRTNRNRRVPKHDRDLSDQFARVLNVESLYRKPEMDFLVWFNSIKGDEIINILESMKSTFRIFSSTKGITIWKNMKVVFP